LLYNNFYTIPFQGRGKSSLFRLKSFFFPMFILGVKLKKYYNPTCVIHDFSKNYFIVVFGESKFLLFLPNE